MRPWLQSWRIELRERVLRERVLVGAHGSWRAGGACNGSHSRRLYVRERVQTRNGWCASVSSAYASGSVRERVISRPPEEGEVSHPISGIGLGVMPVRPHTPRRSVLTSSRWTDPNPSSSAAGATLHHVESEVVIPAAWRTPALPTSAL